MAEDGDTRGSNQPKKGTQGRCLEGKGHGNDEQGSVELGWGSAPAADLEIIALELADTVHSTDNKGDDEHQPQVCDQTVDAEHCEDDGIVAGEVRQVVVDPALGLAEVGGFRHALEIEEFANWSQVGKARGDGLRTQAFEAAGEVHPRGEGIDGNANPRHGGWVIWMLQVVVEAGMVCVEDVSFATGWRVSLFEGGS